MTEVLANGGDMDYARYAIWNNKGGVGKTFVTFVVAAEYATLNADKKIFIVDMCPQANVSEIFLGGNGVGARELAKLLATNPRRTIGGYFDQRITSPHGKTGTETSFPIQLNSINVNLPENMYLIAGDPSLELQAQAINQIAAQTLPADAWRNVHLWLFDLIHSVRMHFGDCVFFIDCNPSFSAYTELALVAANRLIVPCTADGSSARAIDNIGQLMYGIGVPSSYAGVNFAARANAAGLTLPLIHVMPLNRSTQFDKKAAKAFRSMYDEIKRRAETLANGSGAIFSSMPIDSIFLDIPDAHSVSVVCSHLGLPLGRLSVKKYKIHDRNTQVNDDPLKRYRKAVGSLVGRL